MNDSSTSLISARVVRFNELIPCKTAFIDTRTPGSDKKENFCLIGGGVAENPGQVIHIKTPHPFDIGAARQPKGCVNSQHSHDTEEVFVVHRGKWKFTWGETGNDGEAILGEGDTISIPKQVFRGFENVGPDDGFLFCTLGHRADGTAGKVTWAPYVFEKAKDYGLVLLKDGRLIDTTAGQSVPEDGEIYEPVSGDELAAFKRLSLAEMLNCVQLDCELRHVEGGGLSHLEGVREISIVGTGSAAEGTEPGKMGWQHEFQLRRLKLAPGATIPNHTRSEEEVIFVHHGVLSVTAEGEAFTLNPGDLFTAPIGSARAYQNDSEAEVDVIVVRAGNAPQAAQFI